MTKAKDKETKIFEEAVDTSYDEFEAACDKMREENNKLIELFAEDIKGTLAPKTVKRHISNVDLYINAFLLHDEVLPFKVGLDKLQGFFGHFLIHTCLCSSPDTVSHMAGSLKKFYKCMMDHGKITEEEYKDFSEEIKYSKEDWMEECRAKYDGDYSW